MDDSASDLGQYVEIEYRQGHGDGENSVTQREPLYILSGNAVVKR